MYAAVPRTVPASVSVPSPAAIRAIPKSASFGRPSSSKRTLAGFRSRWTTPRACACASPAAMPAAMASVSSSGSGCSVAQPLLERPTGHVLEHHVRPSLRLAVVVELGDVRMSERCDRTRLTLEARRVGVRGEELDRNVAAELEILRAPDLGHASTPQHVVEPVPAGNHGVGHADTLCADRGRLTHLGAGAGARARPRERARERRRACPAGCGARHSRACARAGRPAAVPELGDGRLRDPRRRPSRHAAGCRADRRRAPRNAFARSRRGDGDLDGRRRPGGRRLRHPHRVCCPT